MHVDRRSNQVGRDAATADFFAVLASPIRLAVLRLLVDGELCVTELIEMLGIAQPRLSNHLACLRTCGFVTVRRQGTFLYYALSDHRIADMVQLGRELADPASSALSTCVGLQGER